MRGCATYSCRISTAAAIPVNTAAAKPAKPADTAAIPAAAAKAAAAKAAAAEPASTAATAVVDNISNAIPSVISKAALSAYVALHTKAKAKAKEEEEEEEEEEGEEEEDKEVIKEEKDIESRGKKDKGLYTCFKLLLPYLTISIVATLHMPSKGNS
ncbi:hypothetical protein P8C59_005139 [Phyllachora maydis]|uniref:Uncharacterized protein n=1 Tax=Phyllachora maydis TaxID=1825666 RepID=A0AAD9I503_9PEZI|nr:hypothetical protein P8C59_005139 [Phyllachora maydis]